MVSLKLSNIYDGFLHAELPLEASSRQHEARQRLAVVIDELRKTRGAQAILRGHDFLLEKRFPEKPSPKKAIRGEPASCRGHPRVPIRRTACSFALPHAQPRSRRPRQVSPPPR